MATPTKVRKEKVDQSSGGDDRVSLTTALTHIGKAKENQAFVKEDFMRLAGLVENSKGELRAADQRIDALEKMCDQLLRQQHQADKRESDSIRHRQQR